MVRTERYPARRYRPQGAYTLQAGDMLALAVAVLMASAVGKNDTLFLSLAGLSGVSAWYVLEQRSHLTKRVFSRTLAAPWLAAALTLLVLAATREPYSGTRLLVFAVTWTVVMIAVRAVASRFVPPANVLLIGSAEYFQDLLRSPELDVQVHMRPPDTVLGWDIVAFDGVTPLDAQWLQWLVHADMAGVAVINAHNLAEEVTGKVTIGTLEGRWAAEVFQANSRYRHVKRVLDVAAVMLFSPLIILVCALVALVVLIDSGRPVLFWQERVGKGGTPFQMVKFRTMRADAEKDGAAFANPEDQRVTRVGRLLRKYRLDEVPQFWNVLRGEMSIIGPRPEQRSFVAEFEERIPMYGLRHVVAPGITGWAQVMQGYAAGADESVEKLRFDLHYIRYLSAWKDCRVTIYTLATVLRGFGAR